MAREHLAGAVAGGAFYVLAGRVAGQGNFKVAERYLPRSQRAGSGSPTCASRAAASRAAAVGRRVVVFGGEEATGTIGEVEAYDPATRALEPPAATCAHRATASAACRAAGASTRSRAGRRPGFDFSNAIEALDIAVRRAVAGR